MIERRSRSVVKAITWQIVGIIILSLLTYAITGSVKTMSTLTGTFYAIRIVLYYLNERLWDRINWQREVPKGDAE